ncbi:MAG: flagellar biosynthesis anti-sigma factor FlgM [Zetaproteobacteria bacterium]|nr:MAG: flagellar biosynthesis anti-sigma factor FlgM [Zetaproteobacteria bacterium]
MRITGLGSPASPVQGSRSGKGKATGKARGGGRGRDQVKVADAASLHERARVLLADLPEVRLERIEQIRDALEQGTFEIDERRVAARIVRNALAERSWS